MLECLTGMPPFVIGAKAKAPVTKHDFDNTLAPVFTSVADTYGSISLLLILDADATKNSILPLFEEMRNLKFFTTWKRIAIITESVSIEKILDQFVKLNPTSSKGYKEHELEEAKAWITEE